MLHLRVETACLLHRCLPVKSNSISSTSYSNSFTQIPIKQVDGRRRKHQFSPNHQQASTSNMKVKLSWSLIFPESPAIQYLAFLDYRCHRPSLVRCRQRPGLPSKEGRLPDWLRKLMEHEIIPSHPLYLCTFHFPLFNCHFFFGIIFLR